MTRNILISFVIIFLHQMAVGQSIDLVQYLSGPNQSTPTDMVVTDSGEMIFVGGIANSIDFDPGPGEFILSGPQSTISKSPYICKYDVDGNFLWAKNWNFTVVNSDFRALIDIFSNGDLLFAGYSCCTNIDLDPGVGTSIYASSTITFLVRLSPEGDFISAFPAGTSVLDPRDLVIDSNDNIYFTGVAISGSIQNTFVTKLNEDGTQVWNRAFNGSGNNTIPQKLTVDDNGNVIFVGYTSASPLDLDPGAGTNTTIGFGANDGIICKLDADGNHVWSGRIGGNGQDMFTGVDVDDSGAVYACGYFNSTADLDPFAITQSFTVNSAGYRDYFITKYDAAGNVQFINTFGGPASGDGGTDNDNAKDILVDRIHEKFYVSGVLQSNIDFDPSSDEFSADYSNNNFISTYDLNGNFEMLRILYGSSFDMFLKDDVNGNVYAFGGLTYPLSVYTSNGQVVIPNSGISSLFFLRMSDCEAPVDVSVILSPNPLVGCLSQNVTITATPVNGGENPSYIWYHPNGNVLPGENTSTFSFQANALSPNYLCALVSDERCADRIPSLQANVDYDFSPIVTPTIQLSPETFSPCPNEPVLITAITNYEGNAPLYQWYLDDEPIEGANENTYTIYGLPELTEVSCRLISNELCTTSDTIYSDAFALFYPEMPNVNVFIQGNTLVGVLDPSNDYEWLDCETNQIIPGETQHFYSFEESGTYALIASNFFCADTSQCFSVTYIFPTGVEDSNANGFNLLPNPSRGEVQITVNNGNSNMMIRVLSILGQEVFRENLQSSNGWNLNLEKLEQGVYFVQLQNGEEITTKRLLIE